MRNLVLALVLGGCATAHFEARPTVAREGREAQLCLAEGTLRAGQQIRFERSSCRAGTDGAGPVCSLERVGSGEVVRSFAEHCGVVRIELGVDLKRGDQLEVTTPTAAAALREPEPSASLTSLVSARE